MPRQKQISITFIVSGGKGQSIQLSPSQTLLQLKNKISKKLLLPKDKAIILTYKNKDLFQDQESLLNLQINDKAILYIRIVQKINLQASHKLGQTKMKRSLNIQSNQLKRQDKDITTLQKDYKSENLSKQLISTLIENKQIQNLQRKQQCQKQIFNIFIQIESKKYEFKVTFKTKVFQLKNLIQTKISLNPQEYKIIIKYGSVLLQDTNQLAYYQIKQNQLFHCQLIHQPKNQKNKNPQFKNQQKKENETLNFFQSIRVQQPIQIVGGEEWFQKRKNQNSFINKFTNFMSCDLKKSEIIDDQIEEIQEQENQQMKNPLTPQYSHSNSNFSTPFTPCYMQTSKQKCLSLFQKAQVKSKYWKGQIIQTESISYLQENENLFQQNEMKDCLLNCTDGKRKQFTFQCNNKVRIQDIKNLLSKLQKTSSKNIIIKLQEEILQQLEEDNFLIVDYLIISKKRELLWEYKINHQII